MTYFDDIQFINGGIAPHCSAIMDQRFPDTWSVEFLLEGKMYYGINGGPRRIIAQPAIFWHRPDHTYQYGAVDAHGWSHHWIQFKGVRGMRLVEQGLDALNPAGILFVNQPRTYAELFRLLIPLLTRPPGPFRQARLVLLLERIYAMVLEEQSHDAPDRIYSRLMATFSQRLDTAPLDQYDFPAEARRMGLSYSRFRSLFRQQLGFAPHDYLLRCRMRYAARLLEQPELQIKRVADLCGVSDPARFSRMFKNKIGMAPKFYQQSIPR